MKIKGESKRTATAGESRGRTTRDRTDYTVRRLHHYYKNHWENLYCEPGKKHFPVCKCFSSPLILNTFCRRVFPERCSANGPIANGLRKRISVNSAIIGYHRTKIRTRTHNNTMHHYVQSY